MSPGETCLRAGTLWGRIIARGGGVEVLVEAGGLSDERNI